MLSRSLMAGLFFCFALPACGSEVHIYRSYSYPGIKPSLIKLDFDDRKLVYPHSYSEISRCDDEKFKCFSSDSLNFCVPKYGLDGIKSWLCKKKNYSIEGEQDMVLLGQTIHVKIIKSGKKHFYYSVDRGLIAIKFDSDEPLSQMFIIEASKGF